MSKNNKTNKSKVKKVKKPLSTETKRNIGNVFKSIISNQAAVEGASEAPFWIAIIFFVVSIILPIIPTFVRESSKSATSAVASYNYGAQRGLFKVTEEFTKNGVKFNVVQGGYLSFEGITYNQDGYYVYDDIYKEEAPSTVEVYSFRVYVTEKVGDALSDLVLKLDAQKYEANTLNPYDESKKDYYDETKTEFYTPGFALFAKDTFVLAVYKNGTTTRAGNTPAGLNWNHLDANTNLLETVKKDTAELSGVKLEEKVFSNWKAVINDAYNDQRIITTWQTTGIYLGVYAGLVIFLGLMVFLLTRGKNNEFNYLKFMTCEYIVAWAAFTPAVLGMILSFIFGESMLGVMPFIILISIRVMWLSMRQLRPIQ